MIDLRLAIVAGLHYGLPHGGNKNLALKLFTSDKYGKYGNIYIYYSAQGHLHPTFGWLLVAPIFWVLFYLYSYQFIYISPTS